MPAISAPILVSDYYSLTTEAAQKELNNIREMITCEPCLEQDIPPLAIFTPDSGTTAPSVVLHAAENEYPTMDMLTFVDYEHEVDNISDLCILLCSRKEKEKKKHKGGRKCRKCWEAKQASAQFASAIDTEVGPVKHRGEQESANRSRTIREPGIERSDFMEPEIKRSDFIEPEMKNPDFSIASVRWWRLKRTRTD